MKLKFRNQDIQTDAVNAIADLFAGQSLRTNGSEAFFCASAVQLAACSNNIILYS